MRLKTRTDIFRDIILYQVFGIIIFILVSTYRLDIHFEIPITIVSKAEVDIPIIVYVYILILIFLFIVRIITKLQTKTYVFKLEKLFFKAFIIFLSYMSAFLLHSYGNTLLNSGIWILSQIIILFCSLKYFQKINEKEQHIEKNNIHSPLIEEIFLDKNGKLKYVYDLGMKVDYLNRDELKFRLNKMLKSISKNRNTVIGINGEWGSGKTTLINSVLDDIPKLEKELNLKKIIPLNYSLLQYETIEHLIFDMFDDLTNAVRFKRFLHYKNRRLFKQIVNEKFPIFNTTTKKTLESLSTFLRENNILPIIVLDDIDRGSEKVIKKTFDFLYQVEASIIGLIFIVSYSDKFKKTSMYNFDKIITSEFKVPTTLNQNGRNLIFEILKICLNQNEFSKKELMGGNVYIELLKQSVADSVKSIREFLLFYNSIILTNYESQYFNLSEVIFIELLKEYYPSTFDFVNENQELFLFNKEIYTSIKEKKEYPYNHESKAQLIYSHFNLSYDKDKGEYENNRIDFRICCWLFPTFGELFYEDSAIYSPVSIGEEQLLEKKSITIPKNYQLYITKEYQEIHLIEQSIEKLRETNSESKIDRILLDDFYGKKRSYQRTFIQILESYSEKLTGLNIYLILLSLIKNSHKIDIYEFYGKGLDYGFDRYSHMGSLLISFLDKLDTEYFDKIITFFIENKKYIGILHIIQEFTTIFTYFDRSKANTICESYKTIFSTIIDKEIHIFEKYTPLNNLTLFMGHEKASSYLKGILRKDHLEDYINMLIAPSNTAYGAPENLYAYCLSLSELKMILSFLQLENNEFLEMEFKRKEIKELLNQISVKKLNEVIDERDIVEAFYENQWQHL